MSDRERWCRIGCHDQITKVLRKHREELNEEDVCICGYHGDHPAHVAERVAEVLHLEQILVKKGEIPPLYAIEGWIRGSATGKNP